MLSRRHPAPGFVRSRMPAFFIGALLAILAGACADETESPPPSLATVSGDREPSPAAVEPGPEGDESAAPATDVLSSLDDHPPELLQLLEPWAGDMDGMLERRLVRFLTVYSPMFYALDGAEESGIVYEAARKLQQTLRASRGRRSLPIRVMIIPVSREELIPALLDGRGDVVAANLTITPERLRQVDFTMPLLTGVREIVVTRADVTQPDRVEDLSGLPLHVRPGSSAWESVQRLNRQLLGKGLDPVPVAATLPGLEDRDLVDMVQAGLADRIVVDSHKALFWKGVFPDLVLRQDLSLREHGEVAWAFRPGSPLLEESLNRFVRRHRKGTLFGNVVYQRYLEDTSWVRNALDGGSLQQLTAHAEVFQRYGRQYEIDWLLLAAQAYQESGMDPSVRSHAGAVGIMQLMPATAREMGVRDIHDVEDNIGAGARYMRQLMDRYFDDPALDEAQQRLFALAAYNAGPTRIRQQRRRAGAAGLNADLWFDNVEAMVARRVGREPVTYVSNILKYYAAYRLVSERETAAGGQGGR